MLAEVIPSLPLYFAVWIAAALFCTTFAAVIAVRDGLSAYRPAAAVVVAALVLLLGSKLLYLAESRFFPDDDYVPTEFHSLRHGFRIPGGMLLLAATWPIICRTLRVNARELGDRLVPLLAVAVIFIRTGCFVNGCCFGRVSSVPWAMTFPKDTWVMWFHLSRGWIPPDATRSLPVHPLQLYFLGAALVSLIAVVYSRRHAPYSGYTQIVWYFVFFSSTMWLESYRQNHLTLNVYVCTAAALIFALILFLGLPRYRESRSLTNTRVSG